jgi:hypothetical protein
MEFPQNLRSTPAPVESDEIWGCGTPRFLAKCSAHDGATNNLKVVI